MQINRCYISNLTDMHRYSLAFSAYARATMSFVHTPAYSAPVADMLKTVLKLFVDERVWAYWGQQGDCAPFFLTSYCEENGVSMCDLNQLWHADEDLQCGPPADAVFFGRPPTHLFLLFSTNLTPPPSLPYPHPTPNLNANHTPGNIMYSAHLAQIAVLYQAFARQAGYSELLTFEIAGNDYSLDDLMARIMLQAAENADELGGGITCEPANM